MTEVRYFRMFSYEFQHLGQEREDSARGWGVFMCARFDLFQIMFGTSSQRS